MDDDNSVAGFDFLTQRCSVDGAAQGALDGGGFIGQAGGLAGGQDVGDVGNFEGQAGFAVGQGN